MSASGKPLTRSLSKKGKLTYRGVVLQRPATRSRFSVQEIREAIKDAIAKSAGTLTDAR